VANPQRSHAAACLIAVMGIVIGVKSASSYVAAFMRASNAVYDVPEGRPVWKTMPIRTTQPWAPVDDLPEAGREPGQRLLPVALNRVVDTLHG